MIVAPWIGRLNEISSCWSGCMWRACLQGAMAALIVWLVTRSWKRIPPAIRYGLWWAVCLKLVLGLSPVLIMLPLLPPANRGAMGMPLSAPFHYGHSSPEASTVSPAPVTPEQSAIASQSVLMMCWLVLITTLAGISLVSLFRLRRTVRRAEPLLDAALIAVARDAAETMGMRKTPRVLTTERDAGVLTFGVFRPVVLISSQVMARCSSEELKLMLAHEFAHVRRGDAWLGLLPQLIQILFCFYPIAWLACREVDLAREATCDEQTITCLKARSDLYGQLLIKLGVRQTSWLSHCTPGVSSHYRNLYRRLSMLQQISMAPRRLRGRVIVAACLIGIAAATPWSVVHAQSTGTQASGTSAPIFGSGTTATTGNQVSGMPTGKAVQASSVAKPVTSRQTYVKATVGKPVAPLATRTGSKAVADPAHIQTEAKHSELDAPKRITALFELKYTEAQSIAKTLSTLFEEDDKRNVKIVADVRTNTVIIQATPDKLAEIRPVLDHLDSTEVPVRATARPTTVIPLKYARANDIVTTVSKLFEGKAGAALRIVADERTNSLVVQGPEVQIYDLNELVVRLDVNK